MPPKKNLTQGMIEKVLDDDDLSDIDSGDDPFYGDFIVSPSSSFLQRNEEDTIETRLEEMFGLDDLSDTEPEETSSTQQPSVNLLDILDPKELDKTKQNFSTDNLPQDVISRKVRPIASNIQEYAGTEDVQQFVSNDSLQPEVISC
jgi:hypothetical protein